ncbi:MAG TPA: LCP family protein [Actinomycetota bacterium]|nr:LCP family protein [Actinomycetota bacterium]
MRNPFRRRRGAHSYDLSGMVRSVRTRDRKRFRWLRRKWVWIPLVVLLLLGGVAGYAAWYYYGLEDDVQDPVAPIVPTETAEEPFNVLLVGSDSREGLTEAEQEKLGADDELADGTQVTGQRADTLILAHVDPETDHVTMVQFPRDLWVRASNGDMMKINEALQLGKSALAQTIIDLTGLRINHYAQINIAGFRDLVDALGGVEVCVPEPIPFDPATGIEVTADEIGMVTFDGDRAIRFVRSRKVFGEGDFARIQNQQKFLAAAIDKLTSPGTFLSWTRVLELRRVAGDNLRIDDDTGLWELYGILQRFRSFDPNNYEAYTVPNLGTGTTEGGASIVVPDRPAMKAMFEAMADNVSPAAADDVPSIDPSTVRVGVYNGTAVAGRAEEAAGELEDATRTATGSVVIEDVDDAGRTGHRDTVVRYEPEARKMAELVAAALPGAELTRGNVAPGVDVAVVVGTRFRTRKIVQILPIPIPKPGALPEVCRE